MLKKADGNWCIEEDAGRINEILSFHSSLPPEERLNSPKLCFGMEIQKTADTVLKKLTEGEALVFGLLTDSHYVVNGTWGATLANINDVNDKVGFDGLIHLGDLQDGMLDKKMCRRIATKCISDMRHICEPLYMAIGNHDTNYFKGNTEWLTEASNMVCMEDLWITMYAGKNKMAGTMWIIQKWTAYDIFIFL